MEHGNSIIGKHVHAILEQMKNRKTLVRMKLIEKDYEQLTIIDDIRKKDKKLFLLIDCPDGFHDLVKNSSGKISCIIISGPYFSLSFFISIPAQTPTLPNILASQKRKALSPIVSWTF